MAWLSGLLLAAQVVAAPAATPGAGSEAVSPLARTNHWAYQPVRAVAPPVVADPAWARSPLDRFIQARWEAQGLRPAVEADSATLCRRLHFALTGLPPEPAERTAFLDASRRDPEAAFARLADQLLASPRFGERWARHWFDVVRFAESVTLRGFIFKEAWRYRDYVIEALNRDLPFDQFVREQLAGDLLGGDTVEERQRRLVATTFLALGNTNLEEQDKRQLDLDVVDEQLDVLGKAFLGQTLGCARCHDHKFDPIPTRDYHALAGILASTRLLQHANVSAWTERPLPLPEAEEASLKSHEAQLAAQRSRIEQLKTELKAATAKHPPHSTTNVAAQALPGIVVDDHEAKAVGEWKASTHNRPYIGAGYRHDDNSGKGAKTLTFQPELPAAGVYEVRLAYTAGDNRAGAVPVTVFSADGERTITVNQRETPPVEGRFVSLGRFRFERSGAGFVLVSNEGTAGHVIADAVQFLPVEPVTAAAPKPAPDPARGGEGTAPARPAARLEAELKSAEAALQQLAGAGPQRPLVMAPVEGQATNLPVYRRGSVHQPGEVVPRGVLSVAFRSPVTPMPADASGRRELADWVASAENPLTARVFVNRVWHWLFGAGLVLSADNFGTTGDAPSHPELLDHLAREFVAHGWSVKWLVREIVTSRTWRQTGAAPAGADPANRLLSHFPRRRLEAECLRDALLAISGELKLAPPRGPTFDRQRAADYGTAVEEPVRSVFLPVFRNALPEFLTAFDFADPGMVTGVRNVSTVAPQALLLLNHPFVRERARQAAGRLLREGPADAEGRLDRAWQTCLGRLPTAAERELARRALAADPDVAAGWTEIFHALFASPDFRHLD